MPNTFKVSYYAIGDKGITANFISPEAVAYDVDEGLNDFALLRQIVNHVNMDFAIVAEPSKQVNAVLSLFQQCLTNDEFTIYPVKVFNPNPKWVVVVEKESVGK
jgi:hypothetical protein